MKIPYATKVTNFAVCVSTRAIFPLKILATALMMSYGAYVCALPMGSAVSAGSANISNSAGAMTITQSTQNASINWQSFNIGQSEIVQFVQPNSHSITLNRVLGSDPSSILGNLSANGKVFLINPNGILFGREAQVNVGGLVASTLNMTDHDFVASDYNFVGASRGTVLNQGVINTLADGGYVALLGANVGNNGIISAKLGTVVLAAGTAITLDLAGDDLLNVTINQGSVNALVQTGGMIQADGGQVLLTAQSAGKLLHSVVNNTGVIEAQAIENHNGTIKLLADMQSGSVNVGGMLDTSAPNSGNGGLIETSGNRVLIADSARINTLAPQGKTGLWLLDPVNYAIAATGGDETPSSVTASLTTSNRVIAATNDITVTDPVAISSAQTLTLNAGHDVLINAPITAVPAGAGLVLTAGNNVNVGAALTVTAASSSITISAGNNVITVAPIMAVAATSSIMINAGNDALIGGAVNAVAANSIINISAGRDVTNTMALLATAAGTVIDLNAGRNVNVNAAIAASAAGSSISLISGLGGIGPGVTGGTVNIGAAVASLNTAIRFNPNGYANTSAEIAAYLAEVTGGVDAKAWVFARVNNKTYNGTNAAILSFQGIPSAGGNVTMTPGTTSFDTKNAGLGKTATFSGATISGADAGRFALFAGSGTSTANITPAAVTVTASNFTKTYGQTPILTAFTTSVLANGETIGSVSETSPGTAQTASVMAGPYPITPGNAIGGTFSASNYTINYVNGVLAVNPANLTVTASNATKLYGQTATPTAFNTAGILNGETIGTVTETSPGSTATASVAGGPYAITPGNASGGTFTASNYAIAYANGTLTISPTNLLVTVANATKTYGETPTLSAFTVIGLMNGETIGAFTETSPGTAANASVMGSPYPIIINSAAGGSFAASNYTIAYINGVLTVRPLVQPLSVLVAPIISDPALPLVNTFVPAWIPSVVLTEMPVELLTIVPTTPTLVLPEAVPTERPTVVPAQMPPKI